MDYDVIIIGGSYAGLAAGLQLARARRRILVLDGGQRRNRFAAHSHGFLTQDGALAADIAAKGREQLLAYPTVTWRDDLAARAEKMAAGFRIHTRDAGQYTATRLVLASGVTDRLPDLPGLAERWGSRIFHCPYCHGYELNRGRIGLLATSPLSMHLAMMLPDWGPTTVFLDGSFEPDDKQATQLEARGATLERTPVARIEGELAMTLKDGRRIELDGLFVASQVEMRNPVATDLGCDLEQGVFGCVIKVDAMKATSVPGVYACGDAARPGGSVPLAVADGTLAGAVAHQSLIFGTQRRL